MKLSIRYAVPGLFTLLLLILYVITASAESRWLLKLVFETDAEGEANFYFDRTHGFSAEDRISIRFKGENFHRTIAMEVLIEDDVVGLRWDPVLSTDESKSFRIQELKWIHDYRLGLPWLNHSVPVDFAMVTCSDEVFLTPLDNGKIGLKVKAGARDPIILLPLPTTR